jgi:hypothetical protein
VVPSIVTATLDSLRSCQKRIYPVTPSLSIVQSERTRRQVLSIPRGGEHESVEPKRMNLN